MSFEYVSFIIRPVAEYLGVSLEIAAIVTAMFLSYVFLGVIGVFRIVWKKPLSKTESLDIKGQVDELGAAPDGIQVEPLSDNQEDIPSEPPAKLPPVSLSSKLKSSRLGFFAKIKELFSSGAQLSEGMLEEAEYLLVGADVGTKMAKTLIGEIQSSISKGEEITHDLFFERLKVKTSQILSADVPEFYLPLEQKKELNTPAIIMMVGVNGVGKTTTCAKLAAKYKDVGYKVLLVAADTFRAAAVRQISLWGEKVGVTVHAGAEESKPQAVVFDAMVRAKEEGFEVVIVDTAGRLHTKSSLMQELGGVKSAISRHFPDGPQETLLVVDGSTGQNAIAQAGEFNEAVKLTGLVITKLDGTPKGGIVVAIKDEFGIPIRFIGVGESEEDLREFKYEEFVEALFDVSSPMDKQVETAHAETRKRKRRAA